MASTNNSPSICPGLTPTFWSAFDIVHDGVYYVLAPIFFIFGLSGQIMCLIAFLKEYKKDATYIYQIFVSISQGAEVIFYTVYVLTLKFGSGVERDSAVWFKNNLFLVWYTAHFATVMYNIPATMSLHVALCMAIDRFCAMYFPHKYKNWNHKRNRRIALGVSFTISVGTTIFAIWRFLLLDSPNPSTGYYQVVFNVPFASTKLGAGLAYLRNIERLVAVFVLIIFNGANLKLFRSRILKVGADDSVANAKNTKQKKMAAERTLFILVIAESSLATLAMMALSTYLFAIFIFPSFTNCGGLMLSALVDMVLNLCNMGKFYLVLAMDGRFRKMILYACFKKKPSTDETAWKTEGKTGVYTRGAGNGTMAHVSG